MTTGITLEEAWERAADHLSDAATELARAQTAAQAWQAEEQRADATVHALIGQGYAALATAAAAGLASGDPAARHRWQQLAADRGGH